MLRVKPDVAHNALHDAIAQTKWLMNIASTHSIPL